MTSQHERVFRKNRWGHFIPRGPKAWRYTVIGFAAFLALGGVGFGLVQSGHDLAGKIILGALVVAILVYNGFVSTRSDL